MNLTKAKRMIATCKSPDDLTKLRNYIDARRTLLQTRNRLEGEKMLWAILSKLSHDTILYACDRSHAIARGCWARPLRIYRRHIRTEARTKIILMRSPDDYMHVTKSECYQLKLSVTPPVEAVIEALEKS